MLRLGIQIAAPVFFPASGRGSSAKKQAIGSHIIPARIGLENPIRPEDAR